MQRQVINRDNGVQTIVQLNNDGSLTTGTIQDCTSILERAKAMHNEGLHGSKDMRLAASVPMVVIEKWCNDNGVAYEELGRSNELKRRMLNDPAISAFRVWGGRV
jgi:hypothetical protein